MALTQEQWKIALGIAIGVGVTLIIAGVIVLLVILLSKESFCDKPADLPTSMYIFESEGNVKIQWTLTGLTCNGSYLLQYSVNGGEEVEVPTETFFYIVITPPVCADMLIRLRTVGESGRISDESLYQNYTVVPLNARVSNTAVTRTNAGIIASWEKPEGFEDCDVSYIVRFSSELTEIYEETTAHSIIVPEDLFCLSLWVQVASVVGFSQTNLATVGDAYANIVIDLSIAPEDPFTLIATWSQHNEDICSLSYKVTYAIGTQTQTSAVSVPRTTFDIQYCVVAMVTLIPSAFDGEYTGSQTFKTTRQEPNNIVFPPIENAQFLMNGLSMYVSWDLPDALSWCDDLYNVTARNDYLNEEDSCQGSSGCLVTLTSFCPSTEFLISPIGLKGDSFVREISC